MLKRSRDPLGPVTTPRSGLVAIRPTSARRSAAGSGVKEAHAEPQTSRRTRGMAEKLSRMKASGPSGTRFESRTRRSTRPG